MKLWLLTQTKNSGYDTHDGCVVAAKTKEDARKIHPADYEADREWWKEGNMYDSWAPSLEDVDVKLLGEAARGTARGVILASFNAG